MQALEAAIAKEDKGVTREVRKENGTVCAVFPLKRSLCQDRLGTNIGKALKKETTVFLQLRRRDSQRSLQEP